MRRLRARIIWDVRLQWRNGFYYAALAVVVMFLIVLAWLPRASMSWLLPVVIFGNLAANGFYFMAGLVLLEKAEGSLEAQVVTPLRDREYLLAKVVTLCALSLVESGIIAGAAYGGEIHWASAALGVLLMTGAFACFGFLTVARYDSINEFIFPSVLVVTLLSIPLVDLLGIWSSPILYLHPLHASLRLLRAAFSPTSSAELAFAALVAAAWLAVAFAWCLRGFHRFVVMRQGAR